MPSKEVVLVKAFSKIPEQGNPAGVVFDSEELSDATMLSIASNLGYSESAFVSQSSKADFQVRFFTPTQEVSLCGHATVATLFAMFDSGQIKAGKFSFQAQKSLVEVEVSEEGLVEMTQSEPKFWNPVSNRKKVAQLLKLSLEDLSNYPIQLVSTGTPKLMIPVKSLEGLHRIKPDLEGILNYCKESDVRGFYPFTQETISESSHFHARQFNPLAGINEDPITGIAAGALGCYAQLHQLTTEKTMVIEQGYVMNMGGKVYVDVSDGVRIGGYAVVFGKKDIELSVRNV